MNTNTFTTGAERHTPPASVNQRGIWVDRTEEARREPGEWFRVPYLQNGCGSAKDRVMSYAHAGEKWETTARVHTKDDPSPKGCWFYYRLSAHDPR